MNFQEAIKNKEWKDAMDEEIKAIEKNGTWELTSVPQGHKAIGVKWVYKAKKNAKGEIGRYKARLVAKGYSQRAGIDYDDVFAPVARLETIRLIISLAAQNKWKIHQMDVKSAFLNRVLEEEVYIQQSPGYEVKRQEDKVLKLKKALYGLKQAPRVWNSQIDKYLQDRGFIKFPYEHALYIKNNNGNILIVCLYVDDLIFTENNPMMFQEFKQAMTKEFEMTYIGLMAYYLGIEVHQMKDGIFISQESYAKEMLKKFHMDNYKPTNTPIECGVKLSKHAEEESVDPTFFKSLVGSLHYLTCTRPDILYAVGLVSRYMETPTTSHLKTAKRILRCIKGTIHFGLLYSSSNDFKLVGYSDSDWAGDMDDRKSTTGYVFFMGDTAFTWISNKQSIVSLSTCEAEYIAATSCVCHAIWLRNLLKELSLPQEEATKIHVDNKSAIALAKNPIFHDRSKHIDTRYHYIRECITRKEVQAEYVKSQDQIADIFTKPLNPTSIVAAMADMSLDPIMEKIISFCFRYVEDQVRWNKRTKEELRRLREKYPKIQAVVHFASSQEQITEKNPALNEWLWQLHDAIDDADDVVDDLEYMELEKQVTKNKKLRRVRSNMKSMKKKLNKIGNRVIKRDPNLKRLEEAVQKLDEVSTDVTNFLHLLDSAKQEQKEQEVDFYRTRETGYLPKNDLIGRGKDKESVVQWLRKPSSNESRTTWYRNISLLSIVGHGGMGKTTLLQHVYEDEVTKEFDLKMWVCVSNNFDAKKVIADMLECLKKERPRLDTLGTLQGGLKEELMSKM
ncbi:hypothetical protein KFK09_023083 [Dendrobium nobile]|uniref:Uncharacterized protein n=1 Tax=Dendrobium nobile TaxID=94219 RepID=A0A8T3AK17_DENNO|nr:hypothetical protein KFK09_023083 [Dendrobium nobile]